MPGDGTSGWGLWINHDGNSMQRSTATVRGSVIERSHDLGVALIGSDATIESTTVRATRRAPNTPYSGTGIAVRNKFAFAERAVLDLRSSLITDSRGVALFILGSDATVTGSAIRDTLPTEPPDQVVGGRGVSVEPDTMVVQPSTLQMSSSLVAKNHDTGIIVIASQATVESTVVSETYTEPLTGKFGRGMNVQFDPMLPQLPANLTVRRSLVERSLEAGIAILGATGTIEETTIRDTYPRSLDQKGGRGVIVQQGPGTTTSSSATLDLVLIERSIDIGIAVASSTATIAHSVVRETSARPVDGLFGDGICAADFGLPTRIDITATRVDQSARAGVSSFSSLVTLHGVALECNTLSLASQKIGSTAASFEDSGGNVCGCQGEEVTCKTSTDAIEVPETLE
jgi:hypothetical protein